MQKVSYIGNGSTTEFTFNFPYFENSNIIVTKNGSDATGYTIIGTSAGSDADIPYTGGKVVFETAPTALDSITIARNLPLSRIADYQPTEKINPTTLNQDINYVMEVIKDLSDGVASLRADYAVISSNESVQEIINKMNATNSQITNLNNATQDIGGIAGISTNITALKNAENFTDSGKSVLANMSMPSTRYTDLTLGTSGANYTAPADGYICLEKTSTAANQNIRFVAGDAQRSICVSNASGQQLSFFIAVQKNRSFRIDYTAAGTTNVFRFVYANGAS